MAAPRLRSLRRRIALWIGGVSLAAIAGLTAATVVAERSLVMSLRRSAGESLVTHLAEMREFRRGEAEARRHLQTLAPVLAAGGATLELEEVSAPTFTHALVTRRLTLDAKSYELRYRATESWPASVVWRGIALHVMHGAAALVLLLAGVEWMLRTRLVAPLSQIAHQLRFMGNGGGWSPKLPVTDGEIGDVGSAIAELGPALADQVQQWIEAERRTAIATTLAEVRRRLRAPQQRVLALASDLQARAVVAPEAKQRLRALLAEIDGLSAATRDVERESFAVSCSSHEGGPVAAAAVAPEH